MNVPLITVDADAAQVAYEQYRDQVRKRHSEEDAAIARGYRALAQGRTLLDLDQVFADLDQWDGAGLPRVAICRATEHQVMCRVSKSNRRVSFYWKEPRSWWSAQERDTKTRVNARIPESVPEWQGPFWEKRQTIVPIVPAALRPKKLHLYHVLWEVERWELVPSPDPMLLKHVGGRLYAVVATWDLTPLEQAIIAGTRA